MRHLSTDLVFDNKRASSRDGRASNYEIHFVGVAIRSVERGGFRHERRGVGKSCFVAGRVESRFERRVV